MDPSNAPYTHDPSTLFFQKDLIRRSIIAAYCAIIILVLPLWWHTTSIERLSLPSSRVSEQVRHHLRIPVKVGLEAETDGTSLATHLQMAVDKFVENDSDRWEGLNVRVYDARTKEAGVIDGSYNVIHGRKALVRDRHLLYPLTADTTLELATTLAALIAPLSSTLEQDYRVAQYSPRYRLSFSLLNEDAAAGSSLLDWEISEAVSHHISPILAQLSVLHNFTIESQVQYHAPLAFIPKTVGHGFGISPEDLTVFVNSAEWTLSSSASNDPVLHFVIFVPSANRRPLHLLDSHGAISPSTSFLLPQWGGIVILNPPELSAGSKLASPSIDTVFASFSSHLLSLLGVPKLPSNLAQTLDAGSALTNWQLHALIRYRALSNARGSKDTLKSIVNLVDQIENMPVGQDVKGDVQGALVALEGMCEASKTSLLETFDLSVRALALSSRAFFNPGMLALLYFPAEHKYAVYTPLFASGVIPLFIAAFKELSAWRRQRRERLLNRDTTIRGEAR